MRAPSTGESLREYGRGLAGGLLFSLPLVLTMEMWWAGFIAEPSRLLALIAFTFVLLLGYNRFAGIRHDASWTEVAIDSVEELGLGIVTAAGLLFLLGRVGPGFSLDESLGKIVVEAAVVAIGFSVGTAQLGDETEDTGMGDTKASPSWRLLSHLVISLCGAVLFAANIAPTEEIVIIATETSSLRLLGLVLFSIAIGSGILFFTEFKRSGAIVKVGGTLDIVLGTTVTYGIALAASAIILMFFGRFEGASLAVCVREIVVLAFPAVIGASAGRLLLHTS